VGIILHPIPQITGLSEDEYFRASTEIVLTSKTEKYKTNIGHKNYNPNQQISVYM